MIHTSRPEAPRPGDGAPAPQAAAQLPRPAALRAWAAAARRAAPWWLPTAALWILFLLLAWQVVAHGPVTGADIRVRNRIQDWAAEPALQWLRPIGHGLADLGDQPAVVAVLLLATAGAVLLRRSWRPLLEALVLGLGLAAVIPLKLWIARPGPGQVVLGDAALGFFPSGHTADAVIGYCGAALLLCRALRVAPISTSTDRNRMLRRGLAGAAAALVGLTIAGLLWSDYHWLSDTLGSLCWCGGVLCLARLLPLPGDTGDTDEDRSIG